MEFNESWEEIYKISEELNILLQSYWHQYSYVNSWQFWIVLALLVVPLAILYFTVDRTRVFEMFFLWIYSTYSLVIYRHGT